MSKTLSFVLLVLFLSVGAQNTTTFGTTVTVAPGSSNIFGIVASSNLNGFPYLTFTNQGSVATQLTVTNAVGNVNKLPTGVTELLSSWGNAGVSTGNLFFTLNANPEVPLTVSLFVPLSLGFTSVNLFTAALPGVDASFIDSSFVGVVQSVNGTTFQLPSSKVSRSYAFGRISATATTVNVLPQVSYGPLVNGTTYRFTADSAGFAVKVLNVAEGVSIQQNNSVFDSSKPPAGNTKVIPYLFSVTVSNNTGFQGQLSFTGALPGVSSNSNNTALAVFSSWYSSTQGNTDQNAWTSLPSQASNPDSNGQATVTGNFTQSAQYTVASNPPASSSATLVASFALFFFAFFVSFF